MRDYHRLSVAPMMSYTDRHFRYLVRQFTKRTLLYTEMVVGTTITYNRKREFLDRILGFDPIEHPIAVQLGGDDPNVLRQAAKVCEDYGYDEVNLNIGCPSDKVQKGRFGACLMTDPARVAELVAAIRADVKIPVTVKHRLGVDDHDDYAFMHRFVDVVRQAGCEIFIAHARKAILKGLSPAQNRSVPPLRYDRIYQLKQDFPQLAIIINGGIQDLTEVVDHLEHVDGAMLGRAAYQHPDLFDFADALVFGEPTRPATDQAQVLAEMNAYIQRQVRGGSRLSFTAKHLVGLFKGQPNARLWRQRITRLIQENPSSFDLTRIYRDVFGGQTVVS